MNKRNWIYGLMACCLSAAAMTACGDDSSSSDSPETLCTANESKCDGVKLMTCTEEGTWTESQDCAASGKICEVSGNTASCKEKSDENPGLDEDCTPGELKCDGTNIMKCGDDKKFAVDQACDADTQECKDVEGVPACANKETAQEPEKECEAGQTICEGDTIRTCGDDNKWADGTNCAASEGDDKICEIRENQAQCVAECTPEATKCSNNAVLTCTDGAYAESTACTETQTCKIGDDGIATCVENETKPEPEKECEAGQTICEGDTIKTCGDDNKWADGTNCAASEGDDKICEIRENQAQCVAECTPEATKCSNNAVLTCTDGAYAESTACTETQTCKIGGDGIATCVEKVTKPEPEKECEAGQTICEGDTIKTCGDDGKWADGTNCAASEGDDKICEIRENQAQCVAECTPESTKCSNNAVLTCTDGAYAESTACTDTQTCKIGGDGIATCVENETKPEPDKCEPGLMQCTDGNIVQKCSEEGTWTDVLNCTDNTDGANVCVVVDNVASCKAVQCAEGKKQCNTIRYLQTCQNGEWVMTQCSKIGAGFQCNSPEGAEPDCRIVSATVNDTDGDTIPDSVEIGPDPSKPIDTDGDTIPDYKSTDSDGDTIPDAFEAGPDPANPVDTDGDTIPDYRDTDSDNNGIPDKVEAGQDPANPVDTDKDGTPDYIDMDNDGDTIPDTIEIKGQALDSHTDPATFSGACKNGNKVGTPENPVDCDGDTVPDYMSTDSDGDTLPDKIEALVFKGDVFARYSTDTDGDTVPDSVEGLCGDLLCDHDNDTIPDIISLDSDGDGLSDTLEYQLGKDPACQGMNPRITPDTDGDGYIDSAEYAVAQQSGGKYTPAQMVCNKNIGVKHVYDFYFELPLNKTDNDILNFIPKVSKLDVVFNVDTTGSMGGTINSVKTNITNMIAKIRTMVSDSGFTLTMFDDFPISGYGGGSDMPITFTGPVSTDDATVKGYMGHGHFIATGGADGPESGIESIYQIITRAGGVTWGSSGKVIFPTIPSGTWGGVGFRANTLPVIVHATDATSHDKDHNPYSTSLVFNPHYMDDLIPVLKNKGVRVIGLDVGGADGYGQMTKFAQESNAIVPVCAFKTSATAWSCGDNKCCLPTATSPMTLNGKDNQCLLKYTGAQNNVDQYITQGVDALVKYGTYEVATKIRGVDIGNGKNTSCFIDRIEALQYVAPPNEPEKSCNPVAAPASITIDGNTPAYKNGFNNFATGTSSTAKTGAQLKFTVHAKNNGCYVPGTETKVFTAYIDVINPTTGLLFDTQPVAIIVPGIPESANN